MKHFREIISFLDQEGFLKSDPQSFAAFADQKINQLQNHSKEVQPGDLFFAMKGAKVDGHHFIEDAYAKGALVCCGEEVRKFDDASSRVYLQLVPDCSTQALSKLAAFFYDHPSQDLLVFGVTGTSGKTTTSFLLRSVLQAHRKKVGLIGTIAISWPENDQEKELPSSLTTPDALALQKIFFQMKKAGCDAVVMEVSSHALVQLRVDWIFFDGMIFLNLSPEHLDFHETMEKYFEAKALLFTKIARHSAHKHPLGIVPAHSIWGQKLLEQSQCFKTVPFHGFQNASFSDQGIKAQFIQDEQVFEIHSPLLGSFQLENIAAAFTLALEYRIPLETIQRGITQLQSVPGRCEKIEGSPDQDFLVWVDYAHKPDALEKMLKTLRKLQTSSTSQLHVLFGCGGNRDSSKRAPMGKIASELADVVWITSDNPRFEDPQDITDQIVQGLADKTSYQVILDRKEAIFKAIDALKPGDYLLIAGKGHETGLQIKNQIFPFDDRKLAREAIVQKTSKNET